MSPGHCRSSPSQTRSDRPASGGLLVVLKSALASFSVIPVPLLSLQLQQPLHSIREATKVFLHRSGRKVTYTATDSRTSRYRTGCTSLMPVLRTDDLLGHFCAHFIQVCAQHLNDVRGDLVFVGHATFPSLTSSLCTALRIRNSAWVIAASLSSGCTVFSAHLFSNVTYCSCTRCSSFCSFPSTVAERFMILVSTDSESALTRPSSFVAGAASLSVSLCNTIRNALFAHLNFLQQLRGKSCHFASSFVCSILCASLKQISCRIAFPVSFTVQFLCLCLIKASVFLHLHATDSGTRSARMHPKRRHDPHIHFQGFPHDRRHVAWLT